MRAFERELSQGGALLAVNHHIETRTDPRQGEDLQELLVGHTRLQSNRTIVEPDYRLDLLEDSA